MILEPTILPPRSISWPLARSWKNTCANPVTANGYSNPNIRVVTNVNQKEMIRFFFINSSDHPEIGQNHVDKFNSEKRRNNATQPVDQEVALQERRCAQRSVPHSTKSERYQ